MELKDVLRTFVGKKHLSESSPLTSLPSTALPCPLFIVLLTVAPLLTYPWLPPLLSFLLQRCYTTWVQITSHFSLLSLFLHSPASISVLLPSISRKLIGMTLLFISIRTVLLEEYSSLSHSSAAELFTSIPKALPYRARRYLY